MTLREVVAMILLAAAMTCVTIGFALFHRGLGFIVGGVLLALWTWLVVWDSDEQDGET